MSKFSPKFDLTEQYKKYQGVLKKAEKGKVVTRFAPEPSGYLHIGHVKAALITYHYAKMYDGKMLLRFDDTNPSKEKQEYVDSIQEDLKSLGIEWAQISYTSNHFEYFEKVAVQLIEKGLAYCDNTPVEQMREQRDNGIESVCRNQTVEENLRLFNKMKTALSPEELQKKIDAKNKPSKAEAKGGSKGKKAADSKKPQVEEDLTNYAGYCLRAKISMDNKNKCMRDPVLYRCNFTPHHRTGTKYRIYPTYDFACPLIDSMEGVTHAMRSKEYTDRVAQYEWVIKKCEVRPVNIFEFSRLNFVNVTLSKRKLTWFVDTKRVDGWDDPRMPTVRGIIRRGLRVESLTEFMLAQGPSKKDNLMEWDKIWATNTALIDPYCPRLTAIRKEKACNLYIENGPEKVEYLSFMLNQDKKACPELKQLRPVPISRNILLDFDDVKELKEGERVVLIKWGKVLIKSIKKNDQNSFDLVGEYLPDDKDFGKSFKKIGFLSKDADIVVSNLVELDHLINVAQVKEEDDFETIVNKNTKFVNQYYIDSLSRTLAVNDCVQLERLGFYKVDRIFQNKQGEKVIDFIFTPDGKEKKMSSHLTTAVDKAQLMKGTGGDNKAQKKQDAKKQQKKNDTAAAQGKKDDKKADKKSALPVLHTTQGNFRSNSILIAADMVFQQFQVKTLQWNELKGKDNMAVNALGQIPSLETKDGNLTQTTAIMKYIALRSKKIQLYGSNDFERAQIDQWLDFTNTDLNAVLRPVLLHIWLWKELSDVELETQLSAVLPLLEYLNNNLKDNKFLVGKSVSIADIYLFSFLVYPFRTVLDASVRSRFGNLTRWFETVAEQKQVVKHYGKNRYPQNKW